MCKSTEKGRVMSENGNNFVWGEHNKDSEL